MPVRTGIRLGVACAAALLLTSLCSAPVANAASVVRSGSRVFYLAAPGEANSLSVSVESGEYVLTDVGAIINLFGQGCSFTADVHTVTCGTAAGDEIGIEARDLNDTVTASVDVKTSICGGPGDDTLSGGSGTNLIAGGSGSDLLVGGDAIDSLLGEGACIGDAGDQPGNDVLVGNAGDDFLVGNPGDDLLQGGPGDDTVIGSEGRDTLDGAAGNDLLLGFEDGDAIHGGAGADTLGGGSGDDRLLGGPGNDLLGVTFALSGSIVSTEAGDDLLDGGGGDDVMNAGPGEAVINRNGLFHPVQRSDETAPNGRDTFAGGAGRDTVTYVNRLLPVAVTLDGASNDGSAGEADQVGRDVEVVVGGARRDVLSAGPFGATLDGGKGDDTISGGPGGDTLLGGADDEGRDSLDGGGGKDSLVGEGGADELTGGPGPDSIDGGGGDDYLDGGDGSNHLSGGSGTDVLRSRLGADTDRCGRGVDFVVLGRATIVKGDCERTERPPPGIRPARARIALRRIAGAPRFSPPQMFRTAPVEDHVRVPFGSGINPGLRGVIEITGVGAPGARHSAVVRGTPFFVARGAANETAALILPRRSGGTCRARTLQVESVGRLRVLSAESNAVGRSATWTTRSSCSGTLTIVKRGRVVVRDARLHRPIKLVAGGRHLARRKRS
jgi:Ca2+-binding RTX toxin-like protein